MTNNEFINETGKVDKIKGSLYFVKLTKSKKCEGCKVCDFGKNNYITVPSLSEVECNEGDEVVLRSPINKKYLSSIIMYLLPILIMLASAIITYSISMNDLYVLIACGISLLFSFVLVFFLDKLVRNKKNMPLIVKNLSNDKKIQE